MLGGSRYPRRGAWPSIELYEDNGEVCVVG